MKRKFGLEVWPNGYCDIYAEGQKVANCFRSNLDHIALRLPDWVEKVTKEPHDPRVPICEVGKDEVILVKEGFKESITIRNPSGRRIKRSEE